MNGLASASCARYVESFLFDKFFKVFFLCRRLIFMDMFLFLLCRVSSFCSRSEVTCAHLSFLPVLAVVPSTSHSLRFSYATAHVVYILLPGYRFVTFLKASKCMYELFPVVQYVKIPLH
jgi:hypothetical protein